MSRPDPKYKINTANQAAVGNTDDMHRNTSKRSSWYLTTHKYLYLNGLIINNASLHNY